MSSTPHNTSFVATNSILVSPIREAYPGQQASNDTGRILSTPAPFMHLHLLHPPRKADSVALLRRRGPIGWSGGPCDPLGCKFVSCASVGLWHSVQAIK